MRVSRARVCLVGVCRDTSRKTAPLHLPREFMAPSTPARRLKPPPTESPVPWMPRHSGFKSDSTPNKLFARVARAIKSLKQLQTGVRVDHISMRAEGYGEIQARYENAANTMVTNPKRDKLICSLHETMLSVELEAAELMLLAQNAEFDADSLHQFAVLVQGMDYTFLAAAGPSDARRKARAPAKRHVTYTCRITLRPDRTGHALGGGA